jgi:hypothetical protein
LFPVYVLMAAVVVTFIPTITGRTTIVLCCPRCHRHSKVTLTDLQSQAAVALLSQVQFATQHNQTCLAMKIPAHDIVDLKQDYAVSVFLEFYA